MSMNGYHPASGNKEGRGYEGMPNRFQTFCSVCNKNVPGGYSEGTYLHITPDWRWQYMCYDHYRAMIEVESWTGNL